MDYPDKDHLVIGKITGHYGIKGWVKVFSYSVPINNILNYKNWFFLFNDDFINYALIDAKEHQKKIIAKFANIDTRDDAKEIIGKDVFINQLDLKKLEDNEYYWRDLEGLSVITAEGFYLGKIQYLFETGANDVMVVKEGDSEYLIPYSLGNIVTDINLDKRKVTVFWDINY